MPTEFQIAALWMEGPLSFLEQLCLKSFVDAGHSVKLYHYGPVRNVPDEVELADAAEVLPRASFLKHDRTGSPALHSDLFRYHLLAENDRTIWADTDAYCVKPFETETGHFHGWESAKHINGGVLSLPRDSDTLRELIEFTRDEFAIPEWYSAKDVRDLEAARDRGEPVHVGEQPWGVWGPHALTHFLKKTGEAKYSLPQECLYPFSFKDRAKMLKPGLDAARFVTENTRSIHLYGRRMRRRLAENEGGTPPEDSLIWRLLKKHEIDPAVAPLPDPARRAAAAPGEAPAFARLPASARYGRGKTNLTDIADRLGSDKGSAKHRFTELYQMLFLPYRSRTITLAQLGLRGSEVNDGGGGRRRPTDLPSVRMWLEFFPKARFHGLDFTDISWSSDARFTFHRCDPERREGIDAAAGAMPPPDIVIDDASHASHHQQNAFLALFPKLKSGGLYLIEGLRWQPSEIERDDAVKTAELFAKYQRQGVFEHPDPEMMSGFNALRVDISGCFLFQSQYVRNRKDQLLVVHKR